MQKQYFLLNWQLYFSFFAVLIHLTCFSQATSTIHFEWGSDTLNGTFFPKTSIHLPVHFSDDTTTYYFQLDTGSDQSFIYDKHPFLKQSTTLNATEQQVFSDIGELQLVQSMNQSCYTANGLTHIGTLGADFLQGKIIEIDFPHQTLCFLTNYNTASYHLSPMQLNYGRPVIEIALEGKSYPFMFDTGSSLFELWTSKSLWNKAREKSAMISAFPISSWGKVNTAFQTRLKNKTVLPFCEKISLETIWYNSNKQFEKGFKTIKISGIIGNKPFLNHVLLIDFKEQTMGVKSCE